MTAVQPTQLQNIDVSELPRLVTEVPGPRSRALVDRERVHSSPGLSALSTLSGVAVSQGFGALVEDVDGNVFIDFSSGTVVTVTGHAHPTVVQAIKAEIEKFIHIYDYTSQSRADFLDYLVSVLPEGLDRVQMYTSGAETVEAGLRLARSHTRRTEFISLYRAFHGKTLGALSLMGGGYKKGFGPLASGFYQTPNAYCYRCPLMLEPKTCGAKCADFIENVFEQETTGNVAAVVAEAIQGAGGAIVPPPEYFTKIQEFCRRNDILLFIDEVLTSAGRTGKMWASEHYDIEPDIMTMGKGIGSGFPLGVVASSERVMSSLPWAQHNGGTSTYGGSPVSAAAGLATLITIVNENLIENAAVVGAHIKGRLEEMQTRHQSMGDVRGKGMLMAVEFVTDRQTKERISQEAAEYLYRELVTNGILVASAAPIMRITPPLVMTQELADRALDIFDAAVGRMENQYRIG
ncbi:aspartate aminotransferase family protein [Polymorphospora rubra]|uniref:aspartate aminotransferase family protein n=1 Tax=Polymorphospora rubra TaxID=338584 RepID=UPI0033C18F9E